MKQAASLTVHKTIKRMYRSIKNAAKQVVRKLFPLTSPNFLFHNQFQHARKWAFTYPNGPVEGHYSQFGQDKFVATLLGHKHGGIFLDIGAHDGVSYSNSCFFERELGWYGICVEPHPDAFKRLENNRACTCVNAAVGISDRKAQFLQVVGQGEMVSGLVDSHADLQGAQQYAEHHGSEIHIIEIGCRTVHDILDANNVKALNYLSLDIEGGELEILKTIDLVALNVDILSVENNYSDNRIELYLHKHNYELTSILGSDEIYKRRSA